MGTLTARRITGATAFTQAFARRGAAPAGNAPAKAVIMLRSGRFQVSLRSQEPESYPQSRLGLVIAKRFAKRAVDRNRIKRLLRQNFMVEGLPRVDLFVRLIKPLEGSSRSPQLHAEIRQLWLQAAERVLPATPSIHPPATVPSL
jgi:ribonuclease P protein component